MRRDDEVRLWRRRSTEELARRKDAIPTREDIDAAQKIFNSYYRFHGFCDRIFEIENDERLYNRYLSELPRLEERRDNWFRRLCDMLRPYGVKLKYVAWYARMFGVSDDRDLYMEHFFK